MCSYLMNEQGLRNVPVPCRLPLAENSFLTVCISALLRQLISLLENHQAKYSIKPEIVSMTQ